MSRIVKFFNRGIIRHSSRNRGSSKIEKGAQLNETDTKRVLVKRVVQQFLDEIVAELGKSNRLEFRDFGVFETKLRKARKAQNPKTLEPVAVPEKRTVKFKVGRLMKAKLAAISGAAIDDDAKDVAEMPAAGNDDDDSEQKE